MPEREIREFVKSEIEHNPMAVENLLFALGDFVWRQAQEAEKRDPRSVEYRRLKKVAKAIESAFQTASDELMYLRHR